METDTNKKVLFFLNANSKVARILRRGIVIGIFAFISCSLQQYIPIAPIWATSILTAILAAIDKASRD